MPRGAAPRALLGVLVLIVAIAVAIVPMADARPKDKKDGKQDNVAAETVPADTGSQDASAPVEVVDAAGAEGNRERREEPVAEEAAPPVEQPLTTTGDSNEPTLLALDADGDYLPDALDNCPNVQNPDQADADGDGHGDACPVYQDTDGDTVPDKQDNCPSVATSDFGDNDGDGVGNPCDKSPDGIEPEPEPVPELDGRGGEGEDEPPAPENGDNLNGTEVEREGRDRSRERERIDREPATVTMGSDTEETETADGTGGQTEEGVYEEPVRDNPRRNEELLAEAAASGEIYDPAPPPEPQREWEEQGAPATWDAVVRIDAGATDDAVPGTLEDDEASDQGGGGNDNRGDESRAQQDQAATDGQFARGWMRAKLLLQEELAADETEPAEPVDPADPVAPVEAEGEPVDVAASGSAPVPVENGLVITGNEQDENQDRDKEPDADPPPDEEETDAGSEPDDEGEPQDEVEPLDEAAPRDQDRTSSGSRPDNGNRDERQSRKDDSRRNGSSRGAAAAAPNRQRTDADADAGADEDPEPQDTRRRDRANRDGGLPAGWSDDRYFDGGSALDWSGDIDIAGTDDDGLYLTQRSGSGPGKRRGFSYAIPLEGSGTYLVRLYFAEPYWGAPGGPNGDDGRRVFTVTAEGDTLLEDLDVFAEAGPLTALVKQAEVEVSDGELNLHFTASEGEPIVAAIEILAPSA